MEDKNQKLVELFQRDQLREEQQEHLSVLHKQAKEQEKKPLEKEVASKEQVEQAIQHSLELTCIQEEELAELHRKLTSVQGQVEELQAQRRAWQLYMDMGSVDRQQQIQNLESELDTIEHKYQALSEYVECSFKADICKIDEITSRLIEKEKQLATERALKQVDKHRFQMIGKNDWFKKQLAVYQEEVSVLEASVKNLEEENLEHMKHLFEQRLEDVQISSRAFLTQSENLEHNKLSLPEKAEIGKEQHQQSGEFWEDEMDHSSSSPTHHLNTLLCGSQSNIREPLHLGLLEQKLLSVVGHAMPLYPLPSDSEDLDTLTHLGLFQEQDRTLTTNNIHNRFQ
ncbi:coiled-coil domain-containing protein 83-like [Tachysurus vachellii]|uniref:coiled-coil domain-containing protein 83-like n=1 Tax=Tachysurus vachellii TaxID=175792 RepID=UPI00296AFE8A|nr:coiled-coil domain-containing protein 83-like [Tachysurus vachellii]